MNHHKIAASSLRS